MSENLNPITGFFQELRNRRVLRVMTVYLGTGYVILEASDMIFPRLGLPEWSVTLILGLLLLGFPVAMILAWVFQMTPEGLRRSLSDGKKQDTTQKPLTSNIIIIVLLAAIVILLAFPRFTLEGESREQAGMDTRSIAVLPFNNFSSSDEDVYFADGIHDDILTQLSKIGDVRVISRTTMMKFRNTDLSMQDIAREVGAANILEGSVRRAGSQVRIVAQLIRAPSDEHLWAETYDRDYSDIFQVQSDVARKIARAMETTLSPQEEEQLEVVPTTNMEAYDYFLRGNTFWYTKTTQAGNEKAVAMYERAVELDPDFGLAWARLSIAHAVLYQNSSWDPTPARRELARTTLERAVRLSPDHPEVHFARGIFAEWVAGDPDQAFSEYERALELRPGAAEVASQLGILYFQVEQFQKAGYYLEKAYRLDPEGLGNAAWWAGWNLVQRNFEEADRLYRETVTDFPEIGLTYRYWSYVTFFGYQDVERTRRGFQDAIANTDDAAGFRNSAVFFYMNIGEVETALDLVAEVPDGAWAKTLRGLILASRDRESPETRTALMAARDAISDLLADEPDNYRARSGLGWIQALLGDFGEAERSIQAALDVIPVVERGLSNPPIRYRQAMVFALAGENDKALDILERLLEEPSIYSSGSLVFNPFLSSLTEEPRFRVLLRKYPIPVHQPA